MASSTAHYSQKRNPLDSPARSLNPSDAETAIEKKPRRRAPRGREANVYDAVAGPFYSVHVPPKHEDSSLCTYLSTRCYALDSILTRRHTLYRSCNVDPIARQRRLLLGLGNHHTGPSSPPSTPPRSPQGPAPRCRPRAGGSVV